MSVPSGFANPYEAPAADLSPVSLAEDTEFLFNYSVVAGIGTISLPKICVLSGEKENLAFRSSRLRWCSQLIVIPRNIMFAISLIVVLSDAVSQTRALPGALVVTLYSFTQIVFTFSIMTVTAGLILLSILLRKTVEVNWYLSQKVVRRRSIRLGVILFLATAAIVVIALFGIGRDSGMILIPSTIALMALLRGFKGCQPLRVVGQHNELLLVSGFSRAFAVETLKLVSAWERQQSEPTPKTFIPAPE